MYGQQNIIIYDTHIHIEREKERERHTQPDRDIERDRQTERERQTHGQTDIDRSCKFRAHFDTHHVPVDATMATPSATRYFAAIGRLPKDFG